MHLCHLIFCHLKHAHNYFELLLFIGKVKRITKTVISLGHIEHYMKFYMGKLLCTQYNKQIFVQKSLGQLVKEGGKTHGVHILVRLLTSILKQHGHARDSCIFILSHGFWVKIAQKLKESSLSSVATASPAAAATCP